MTKKKLVVYIYKKKRDINGNPIYHAFIPGLTGKQKGFRKLKTPHNYSFSTYNINQYLRKYALKNYNVLIQKIWNK
jgi:hypothetical protein